MLLSIGMEEINKIELQVVIKKASKLLEGTLMSLVDYTSTIDHSSIPAHYIIYWEMGNNMYTWK